MEESFVTGLTFAAVLQASIMATGAETYAEAHEKVANSGQPLMVLVGADWCPACVEMKNKVIPQVRRRGLLRRVAFAIVNLDRQETLGRQLTDGGPIPQVVMYRKTRNGWKRRRLVGGQSAQTLETFINRGVALDEADKDKSQSEREETPVKRSEKKTSRST